MDVAVIGAGPAGLAAALAVLDHGGRPTVFESAGEVGGLARSVTLWGRRLDLGSHTFEPGDADSAALWRRFASPTVSLPLRKGIRLGTRVLPYPPRPRDLVAALGPVDAARAGFDVVRNRARSRGRPASSTEDVVVGRYGRLLYDRVFRGYVEKLYGISGDCVDRAFADALLAGPPPVVRRRDRFDHPCDGLSVVWERMTKSIIDRGGQVHVNTRVAGLAGMRERVIGVLIGGAIKGFDAVVSTLPLAQLARLLPDAPAAVMDAALSLRARSTVLVFLRTKRQRAVDRLWLYLYDADTRAGRVTNFDQWQPHLDDGSTCLAVEYWCTTGDETWRASDSELIALAQAELAAAGLLDGSVEGHVIRLSGSHPVLSVAASGARSTISTYVEGVVDLVSVGRHGAFNLGGMGETMAAARSAVRTLSISARR